MKRTSNNRVSILYHVDLKRSEKGVSRSTCPCYTLGIISVNHHWAYMKKKKNNHLKPVPQMGEKGNSHPGEEDLFVSQHCPTISHLGDGCNSVQPSGIYKLPVFPVCLSICANGIQCDFKSVWNEIQLQGKNC